MIGVLTSRLTVRIISEGSHSQQKPTTRENVTYRPPWHCSLDFNLFDGRPDRKYMAIHEVNMVSMDKCFSGLSVLRMPGTKWLVGSRGGKDKPFLVASLPFSVGCEGEEAKISCQKREEECNNNSYEQLPPWGNSTVHDDSGVAHSGGRPTSIESKVMVSPFQPKLHFLEEMDEEVLSKRILSLSRSNKFRSALELYMSMEASGLRPNLHACNSLLSCLLRNKMPDDALKIFEIMKEKEMATGHTYSLILKAIASTQGCESALKMFVELEGNGTLEKGFDAIVYNTIISICGKTNNWIQTERMWRKLKENGHPETIVTYRLLVCIFVRCGQIELALDAYHEMVQNGFNPGQDMMQAVIAACTKEGKWSLALRIFQNMRDSGFNPNVSTYNTLINSLGKAGEVKLAFRVYDLMRSSGHAPDVYTWNALIGALNRGNRYADALQLFESIKGEWNSQLNLHLYNTALMSCQRLGYWDRSLQLLWQMEVRGLPVSTASYNLVIGACEAARKPKVALQVYEHMLHQKCSPDTFTYLSLTRACIWGSLWAEVVEILDVSFQFLYVTLSNSLTYSDLN
uniref:Pentatricopeptide repeat-containing protein At3g29290 n=1 Tax=Nelumbo nucifera TaxID=4432 RepID=A0A822YFS0_NELNU|nr:TPA_asm: hypothetical protein HUJ06_010251 [Nelumbo nucifera]